VHPSSTEDAVTGGPVLSLDCENPPTCAALCTCDKNECLAGGGTPQKCGALYKACFFECTH
jgi:hypothetical protein